MNFFLAEAERRRKEEAERKAKLDELAEKQRQRERELDEKERLWKESILRKNTEPPRAVEPACPVEPVAAPAASAASTPGKYVPKHKRVALESAAGAAPPSEPDRWGNCRQDDGPPAGDSWRNDDRRPTSFGGGSRPSWSSSRRGER